jgi:XTP/dITP diphosphohydrolase
MKLLIATRNPHKVLEIQAALKTFRSIECIGLLEIDQIENVEETGASFEANACLKAQHYARHSGFMCLADDSGLEIDALAGQPGVHSARFMGEDTPYAIKNEAILADLKTSPQRTARFVSVVALASGLDPCIHFRGSVEGTIAHSIRGSGGFGYDPIFIPDGFDRSFGEMSFEEKNQLSHRARALEKCKAYLKEWMMND